MFGPTCRSGVECGPVGAGAHSIGIIVDEYHLNRVGGRMMSNLVLSSNIRILQSTIIPRVFILVVDTWTIAIVLVIGRKHEMQAGIDQNGMITFEYIDITIG